MYVYVYLHVYIYININLTVARQMPPLASFHLQAMKVPSDADASWSLPGLTDGLYCQHSDQIYKTITDSQQSRKYSTGQHSSGFVNPSQLRQESHILACHSVHLSTQPTYVRTTLVTGSSCGCRAGDHALSGAVPNPDTGRLDPAENQLRYSLSAAGSEPDAVLP